MSMRRVLIFKGMRERVPYPIVIEEEFIVLIREGKKVYAFENKCTHDNAEIHEGDIGEDGTITCPRHGAMFDYRTGAVKSMPAVTNLRTYPVTIKEGEVCVDIG